MPKTAANKAGNPPETEGNSDPFVLAKRFAEFLVREKGFPNNIFETIRTPRWQRTRPTALIEITTEIELPAESESPPKEEVLLAVIEIFSIEPTIGDDESWSKDLIIHALTASEKFQRQRWSEWAPTAFMASLDSEERIGFKIGTVTESGIYRPFSFDLMPTYREMRQRFEEASERTQPFPAGRPLNIKRSMELPVHENSPMADADGGSLPPSPPPTRSVHSESISDYSVSDRPTSQDSLGFTPYVEGVAQFLLNEKTKAPLTLSIEGEWGCGKSSFMEMLRLALRNDGKIPPKGQKPCDTHAKTVWFNAWRHDKSEELWAAFALTFMEEMTSGRGRCKNLRAAFRLNWERVSDWGGIVWESFRFALVATVWMIVAGAILIQILTGEGGLSEVFKQLTGEKLLTKHLTWLFTGSSLLGGVVFVFMALKKVDELVGNPFKRDFKKYLDAPDYADRISFLERFHKDFRKIVQIYTDGKKVFVFIDDLDRCEVPKAAELMQAINLMISDAAPIFFIIGMDREKVAAGLAAKFEKLLPYLIPGSVKVEQGRSIVVGGLEYGLSFIEKFIQLPFRVPVPAKQNLISLFQEMRGPEAKAGDLAVTPELVATAPVTSAAPDAIATPPNPPSAPATTDPVAIRKPPVEFEFMVAQDSALVRKLMEMVSPALDYNPRRIKQFVNTFRLKAYIAYNTGLFQPDPNFSDSIGLTLPQLAKYVAISLRWPLFVTDLSEDPELLNKVVSDDKIGETERAHEWRRRNRFFALICYEPSKSSGDGLVWENDYLSDRPETFQMKGLEVRRLLRVSPPTIRKPVQAALSEPSEGRINSLGDRRDSSPA